MATFIIVEVEAPILRKNKRRCWRLTTTDYRSKVSFDAFFFGVKGRNYAPNGTLYHAKWEDEYNAEHERLRKFLEEQNHPMIDEDQLVDVESLWEFYKLIGYDYKKQKWIKNEPV